VVRISRFHRDGPGSIPGFGNFRFLRSKGTEVFFCPVQSVPHIETHLLTHLRQICGNFGATRRSKYMRVEIFSPDDHHPPILQGGHPEVQHPMHPLQTWSEHVFGHYLYPMSASIRTVCSSFSYRFPLLARGGKG